MKVKIVIVQKRCLLFIQMFSILLFRKKIDHNSRPTKEDLINFFKPGTTSKKGHCLRFIYSVKSLISVLGILTQEKQNLIRIAQMLQKISKKKKNCIFIKISVVSYGVSLTKLADEVSGNLENEKGVLTEDELISNQYSFNPKKLIKIQRGQNVFVYDVEICSDEGNIDSIPYPVVLFLFQNYLMLWCIEV